MSESKWLDASSASNIDGFWSGEGVITFTPQSKFQFPNKKFKNRMSRVIVGKLAAEAPLIDKDGAEIEGAEGQTVGIWFAPGMAELLNLGFAMVRMKRDESLDKDVGQPQLMKGYRIQYQGTPRPLPNAPRFSAGDWEEAVSNKMAVAPGVTAGDEATDDDNIPF